MSDTSKHTSSPLTVRRNFSIDGDRDIETFSVMKGQYGELARTSESGTSVSTEENRANANLFAASPDLLMACEAIIRGWEENNRVCPASMMPGIDRARAALAKAEGR